MYFCAHRRVGQSGGCAELVDAQNCVSINHILDILLLERVLVHLSFLGSLDCPNTSLVKKTETTNV